jgi:putative aldouronate transport system permease protein
MASPTLAKNRWQLFRNQKQLYLMSFPFLIVVFIFSYVPIWGWIMAFQKYKPSRGFFEQQWVGLQWFIEIFQDPRFYNALTNTLAMSLLSLMINFTCPIIFAILLNEVRHMAFKRTVQTISYLPHFVSWVVVGGMVYMMLSTDGGAINNLLVSIGILKEPQLFMAKPDWFWGIVTATDLWKELGWNAIIFLAAITGIDPQLYEAAKVDGAGKLRQIWHITLPGISHVVVVLLILSIGNILAIGFEKQFQLGNPRVLDRSEVMDLYSLALGINQGRFSIGTAIGMLNSIVSISLLLTANGLFKRFTGKSVI